MRPQPVIADLSSILGRVCDTLHAPGIVVGLALDGAEPSVVAIGVRSECRNRCRSHLAGDGRLNEVDEVRGHA
jgi:hypothetical protein